ncbi:hypothetical protein EBQ90_10280 [bacterium]|nr:hypothetical protein [bacterium]
MELNRENFRNELTSFRSQIKPEMVNVAEKSLRLEKHGPVAVIIFDQHEEKANKLSSANMLRFFELLVEVEKDSNLKALLVTSKKPSISLPELISEKSELWLQEQLRQTR